MGRLEIHLVFHKHVSVASFSPLIITIMIDEKSCYRQLSSQGFSPSSIINSTVFFSGDFIIRTHLFAGIFVGTNVFPARTQ